MTVPSALAARAAVVPTIVPIGRDGLWPGTVRHRFGSLFSSPPWIDALARTYGLAFSASARIENGAVVAAIPFCHVTDVRGERVVGLPFSDYCDPLVETSADWEQLVAPILGLDRPVSLRCLWNPIPARDSRFEIVGRAMWHGVDLTRPEDELWAGLSPSARQNVRRAERSGVVVRAGKTVEDVRIFHRMHAHVRKSKYRLLAQPLAFFTNLHQAFAANDGITVLLAEVAGQPVAGILLLTWRDTLYYKFNASTDLKFRPNDILMWHSMMLGHSLELARLDLGASDLDQPGLVRYKRKFATDEALINTLRWRRPGYFDPRGEEVTQLLHQITELFTDPAVPDEITREAGERIYRFFC